MKPLVISLFEEHPALPVILKEQGYALGEVMLRTFPDGETYLRFQSELKHRAVILVASLDSPNSKILPLILAAETARAFGASQVGLCAPYLAYMRQDKQFKSGESITSLYFAKLISKYFDWLVTVDPHLHRYHKLDEVYSISSCTVHATQKIAQWIKGNVKKPLLIGPDSESKQWVEQVSKVLNVPYLTLKKKRYAGDEVEVSSVPEMERYPNHTPVLLDDIISTAQTMIMVVQHLKKVQSEPIVCVGIHAVFSNGAYEALLQAGAALVVTTNTIKHMSNQIDVSSQLGEGMHRQIKQTQ